jgi:hypothetical protein
LFAYVEIGALDDIRPRANQLGHVVQINGQKTIIEKITRSLEIHDGRSASHRGSLNYLSLLEMCKMCVAFIKRIIKKAYLWVTCQKSVLFAHGNKSDNCPTWT